MNKVIKNIKGVDFNTKTVRLDEKNELKMQIWDTAGQEKYRSLVSNYFRNANGAMLVFDITSKKTFENLKKSWLENLKKFAPENICKVVLANKCDKIAEIEVQNEEIKDFEKQYNIHCFRTSAKDNVGISEAFLHLAKLINENYLLITSKNAHRSLKNKGENSRLISLSIKVSSSKRKETETEKDGCC